jgi:hypothetical protein
MRKCDGSEWHACCTGNKGLDGNVFTVSGLDGGGGFDLDHAPGRWGVLYWQQHVCKRHRPLGGKAGFEDGLWGVEQGQAQRERGVNPFGKGLDDGALTCGVIQLLGDRSDLMSGSKVFLGGGGDYAQVWVMDLEPHALGALAIGHQL